MKSGKGMNGETGGTEGKWKMKKKAEITVGLDGNIKG